MATTVKLTIQQWGNSLAVRIPSAVARPAHFKVGQPVEMTLEESGLMLKPVGAPKLTLNQKLARYDAGLHGGEVMASQPVGVEVL
ncbi:MAG: AbrB/MazE/SpoVT family DNA-binding domain-containing protein [Burkholderiaceae bacterium]|nr:MAG: AbrB/MazE/SpoVT family DNA-binding domain-containing protein [Burkholderiaceae bacterium]